MIATRFTRAYNLEAPIVSAGMAFVTTPPLAAAVSNAGGLGALGGVMVPAEPLREMVRGVRRLTGRPFGVDLITEFVAPEHIEVCVSERVPVIVFFWGFPDGIYLQRLRDVGTRLWMQVGSVGEARGSRRAGF